MIALGHRASDVWDYTPRQMRAFLFMARRRRAIELAESLSDARLAAHGTPDAVSKRLRTLTR